MNRDDILKELEQIKSHIESFVLDREDGTKKMQEEFRKNAVAELNSYIISSNKKITSYRNIVEDLIHKRALSLMPQITNYSDMDKLIEEDSLKFIMTDRYISDSYKIGIDFILDSIDSDISLTVLNKKLVECLNIFNNVGIKYSIEDFNYSMFVYKYMELFLSVEDKDSAEFNSRIRDLFEHIYWECPDIINHIKLNINYILNKNSKVISNYISSKSLDSRDVCLSKYIEDVRVRTLRYDMDSYNYLDKFINNKLNIIDYLEGAGVRNKNFNQLVDFDNLLENDKNKFKDSIHDLYYDLLELKNYYRYEGIIKDLLKRYNDKDTTKAEYLAKLKELDKEEVIRIKIYKEYQRSMGIGFLARKNPDKQKSLKIKINEQIGKIYKIYTEVNELEIGYKLSLYVDDASTLYNLFGIAFSSFTYLKKELNKIFVDTPLDTRDMMSSYMKFVYNPSNTFIRKISGFSSFSIASVVSDRYKLLGLMISDTDIDKDHIDMFIDTVRFINDVYNMESSNLKINDIKFLVDSNKIVPIEEEKKVAEFI